jgi:predicted dehydrogenase
MPDPIHPTRRDLMLAAGGLAAGAALVGAGGASAQTTAGGVVEGPDVPNSLVGRPPEVEKPLPEPEARRLGWAVAGLGHFATTYQIPALGRARKSRLTGLVSGNPDKAADIAARTGVATSHVYSYETFDSIRDDDAIDVVYVITPNSLHRELVVRALEAGKHVMVEKPMATSAADAEAMIAAAEANDRRLMVAYRAHFEPYNLETDRLIREGLLGDVSYATSDHHRPLVPEDPKDQWRMKKDLAGGGSFTDIGIYSLNGLIWFMGEPVEALSAHTWSPPGDARFAEVEAVAAVRLRFPSGRLAQISSGYIADTKRIEVFGSEAVATLDPATEYMGNALMLKTAEGNEEVSLQDGSQEQFVREIDHLSEVIMEGGEIRTPGAMGLRDVRLIEAVYASAAQDGAWLKVDPDGRLLD